MVDNDSPVKLPAPSASTTTPASHRERGAARAVGWTAVALTVMTAVYGGAAGQLKLGTLAQPGPGFFPLLVVTPALALGVAGLFATALKERGGVDWPSRSGWVRIGVVSAATAGYIVFAPLLGHALVSGLLSLLLLSVFGLYRLPVRIAAAALLAVTSDILFSYLLSAPLPRGPFGWYW